MLKFHSPTAAYTATDASKYAIQHILIVAKASWLTGSFLMYAETMVADTVY